MNKLLIKYVSFRYRNRRIGISIETIIVTSSLIWFTLVVTEKRWSISIYSLLLALFFALVAAFFYKIDQIKANGGK